MQTKKLIAALLGACALAGSASAATFQSASGAGAVTDYSGVSLASFDLDFSSFGTTTLNFSFDAGDIGSPLSFNALVRNLTGLGLEGASFSLLGATWTAGSVGTDGFQTVSGGGHNANNGWVTFNLPLTTEFYV